MIRGGEEAGGVIDAHRHIARGVEDGAGPSIAATARTSAMRRNPWSRGDEIPGAGKAMREERRGMRLPDGQVEPHGKPRAVAPGEGELPAAHVLLP